MDISDELLFFFSGLGAFNGFLLAAYFGIWARPKSRSNIFLGLFLFILSVRVTKSIFYYFIPDLGYLYLQIGLTACFLIGPFIYFYFASIAHPEDGSKPKWQLHLAILTPIILLINFLVPFGSHIDLWDPYIVRGIYATWTGYSIAAIYKVKDIFPKIVDRENKIDKFDFWLLTIWIGNTLILLAYMFRGIGSYILGALLFSFLYYILFILLVFRFQKVPYNIAQRQKYGRRKIDNADVLINRLETLMEAEKLYRNPLLKLQDLASKLNILPHTLSQLLNENMDKGFSQFLNEYRINEACDIIKMNNDLGYEAIGYEVGYNSKSTFYKAFNKITGTTPAKFKTQNLS